MKTKNYFLLILLVFGLFTQAQTTLSIRGTITGQQIPFLSEGIFYNIDDVCAFEGNITGDGRLEFKAGFQYQFKKQPISIQLYPFWMNMKVEEGYNTPISIQSTYHLKDLKYNNKKPILYPTHLIVGTDYFLDGFRPYVKFVWSSKAFIVEE